MDEFYKLLILIAVIIVGIIGTYFTLKHTFKKSVLVKIGLIIAGILSVSIFLIKLPIGHSFLHIVIVLPLCVFLICMGVKYIHNELIKPLQEIKKAIQSVTDGKLNVEINEDLKLRDDEFGEIATLTDEMTTKINEIIESIIQISDAMKKTGDSLNFDSNEMAQLASEQAASVEEVSAAMEEMASSISQNSDASEEAVKMARKSAVKIDVNDKNVQRTVGALNDIIKKVSVISDIAFQTNILSLNAAIEGAKAKEFGKGFNVVANEIRKLASKSKSAANEIAQISKASMSTAQRTGRISKQIVPDIQKTSRLIKEISASSKEQNAGAEQVNNSVQQLNNATQQFAERTQNIAANAQELRQLSSILESNIEFFKPKDKKNEDDDKKSKNEKEIVENSNNEINIKDKIGFNIDLSDAKDYDDDFETF